MAAQVEAIRSVEISGAFSGGRFAAVRTLLACWHLLSLDAATVAVVWCVAFARAGRVHMPAAYPLALGAVAWMLYVSDRLLDVLLLDKRRGEWSSLRERHWFHARHRRWFFAPLAAASLFALWVIFRGMPRPVLIADGLLGCVAGLYFARVHLGDYCGLRPLVAPWKELMVGTIFALAVAIPALGRGAHAWALLAPVAGFAALCFLNCLVIEETETSTASRWTGTALVALALLCLLAMMLHSEGEPLLVCIGLSACLLRLLMGCHRRLSALEFRIGADAALLTPLLFLFWPRT